MKKRIDYLGHKIVLSANAILILVPFRTDPKS